MAVSPRNFDLPRADLAMLAGRTFEDCGAVNGGIGGARTDSRHRARGDP